MKKSIKKMVTTSLLALTLAGAGGSIASAATVWYKGSAVYWIMDVLLVCGAIHTFNLVFTNIQQLRMEHSQDGNDLWLKHVHLNTSELVQHNATGIVGKRL